jgi:hypothetical protein
MSNIYQLEKEIEELLEIYYDCFDENWELRVEDEVFEKVNNELIELQNRKSDFIEWILKKRVNLNSDILWVKSEIERLNKMVQSYEKQLEKTDSFVEKIVKPVYEWSPIIYWNFKVSFRKSESLVIDDESLISEDLKIFVPPSDWYFKTDKNVLKKALKEWVEIQGIHIETKENLQIK